MKIFAAHLLAQQLLHLDQIGHHQRTNLVALGIKEVQGDDLVLDQVIVEAYLFALMGYQWNVGQVHSLDAPAAPIPTAYSSRSRQPALRRRQRTPPAKGAIPSQAQQSFFSIIILFMARSCS